jgi:hypothetical protein
MTHSRSRGYPHAAAPFLVALAVLIAGCSSGSSSESDDGNGDGVAKPDIAAECRDIQAIEGGGRRHKLSGVLSSVDADGVLSVSDVRITTTDAAVYVDGSAATTAELETGDVVTVAGSFDLEQRQGCASRVVDDAELTAAVDSVNSARHSLVVLGQEVKVAAETAFGEGADLSALEAGERVRVSGMQSTGAIIASRIELAAGDGYFVAGAVRALDDVQRTFVLNEFRVQYDGAALANLALTELQLGDFVRVTGTVASGSAPTVLQAERVERIDHGTAIEIYPEAVSLHASVTMQFQVTKADGPMQWRLGRTDGVACSATECGTIDAAGRYTAPARALGTRLMVTASSVADPRLEATATVLIHDPWDVPIAGSHVLRGEVFAAGVGPVRSQVDIWVALDRAGYSYTWANGVVRSDEAGNFIAPSLPYSHVSLWTAAPAYVQPCAVTARVESDVDVQVELVPRSAFDATEVPRPQLAVEPSLTGRVYEVTATGQQPIAGAVVWLEGSVGPTYAQTLTDLDGDYFVCNVDDLPGVASLIVVKEGYEIAEVWPVNGPDSRTFDIEMKRLP